MNWIISQWENWKAKSIWSKLSDIVFTALLIVMLIPEGRIFVQRMVLKTGLFGSTDVNADGMLTETSRSWLLTDLEGNSMQLKELEGKVVFINFWATWCPPCNAEMPGIISLMERVGVDMQFIFVTNENTTTVQKHLTKKGWDIPVFIYQNSPGSELSAESLPTTYIIDKQGKIVHHSAGMKNWNSDDAVEMLNSLSADK
jgi:thiol-disulfide isomerase/thioredoxin